MGDMYAARAASQRRNSALLFLSYNTELYFRPVDYASLVLILFSSFFLGYGALVSMSTIMTAVRGVSSQRGEKSYADDGADRYAGCGKGKLFEKQIAANKALSK